MLGKRPNLKTSTKWDDAIGRSAFVEECIAFPSSWKTRKDVSPSHSKDVVSNMSYVEIRDKIHNVGVVWSQPVDDERSSSALGIERIMECFGLIPDELKYVMCVSTSASMRLKDLPFDFADDAVLLFADDPKQEALYSKDLFGRPTKERLCNSADTEWLAQWLPDESDESSFGTITYLGELTDDMVSSLGKLTIAKSACGALNIFDTLNGKRENSASANYVSRPDGTTIDELDQAVRFLSSDVLSLDCDTAVPVRLGLRLASQPLVFSKIVEKRRPDLAATNRMVNDVIELWCYMMEHDGEIGSLRELTVDSARQLMNELAVDKYMKALVKHKIPIEDLVLDGSNRKVGDGFSSSSWSWRLAL